MTTQFSKKRKRATSDRKAITHSNKNITKSKKPLEETAEAEEISHHSPTKDGKDKELVEGVDIKTFTELGLSQQLANSLSTTGVSIPSTLQCKIVPRLLQGEDVSVVSNSSDAALAFLLSAVARLEKQRSRPRHGTVVAVITASRESAVQLTGQATEMLSGTSHTVGLVVDEANRGAEVEKLERGLNLLIGTPARMADHFLNTTGLVVKNFQTLFVNRADQIVDLGQERHLKDILSQIPKEGRQTGISGRMRTEGFTRLQELICRAEMLYTYDETNSSSESRPITDRKQGYVQVDADKRFLLLHSFLKKFQQKRILVIMSSTAEVMFYAELLNNSLLEQPVHEIHGKQSIKKRAAIAAEFSANGCLLGTKEALEGIKISPVDWTIHFDPPRTVQDIRDSDSRGRSVIFLLPSELEYIEQWKAANLEVEEFDFPKRKLSSIQDQVEKLVAKNYELNVLAKDGFRSYLQSYSSQQPNAGTFDITKLNVAKIARSFGFAIPPRVNNLLEEISKPMDKTRRPYGPTTSEVPKKKRRAA